MVYANKRERETERDVCKYIVTKVLNQGNLTRITGITTQNELAQYESESKVEHQKQKQEEKYA